MLFVSELTTRRLGPGLVLRSLRQPSVGGAVDPAFDRAMGSVLNIDEFWMTARHFAPHPHAGFSAVTYMLPSSAGSFRNRDSLGDDCRIAPGSLHATEAGAGMLHEEMPELDGVECHGLQLFIKVRPELELAPPRALHIRAELIPRLQRDDVTVRVLFGAVDHVDGRWILGARAGSTSSVRGPLEAHSTLDLGEFVLAAGGSFELRGTPAHGAFAMVLEGEGHADDRPIAPGHALAWTADQGCRLRAGQDPLRLLVGCGEPLAGPVLNEGPFFAHSRERLHDYVQRFASGSMGVLT